MVFSDESLRLLVMPSVWLRLPIAAFLVVLSATTAFAQFIPGWDTKQFTIERLDADRFRLIGEVEVTGTGSNNGQQIFADNLEWNIQTGEFTASGNVLLVSPTSRLSADRVVFNTKQSRGTFYTASGVASLGSQGIQDKSMFGTLEPDVYFYGEVIDKIGEDKYRIKNGAFTTCVQPTPRWEIVSGSATINLGDYAILRNAVLRVKEVPLFYLPVLYYPIQDDDRATGFLLPTYGASTFRGQSLSNAFFWAINRSQDATFFHDWYTKTGQGAGSEYRYVLAPGAEGFFRGYWLNQKSATFEVPGGGTTTTDAKRSHELRGQLVQPLPARMTVRASVDYFSDLVSQQLYNQNIFDATRSQRSYNSTLTGSWGPLSVTGLFARSELFLSSTRSLITGSAPSAMVNFASTKLGVFPVYFAMNNESSHVTYNDRSTSETGLVTDDDRGLTRVDLFPTLRAPLTKLPFLTVNGYLGFRSTYYSESLDQAGIQAPIGLRRHYAEMRTEVVGPIFSRVFTPQNAFADRVKHIIEPLFSVQRTTSIDNQNLVPSVGSSYDVVVGGVTRINYGLTNRLMLRKTPKPVPGREAEPTSAAAAPREFLSATISQSYYSDDQASRYDRQYVLYGGRAPSKFSPVSLNVRTAPTTRSSGTLAMAYDAQRGSLESVSAAGVLDYPLASTSIGWSNLKLGTERNNALNAQTSLKFDQGRVGGTYSMNWDITRRTVLQQRWIGTYNAQCCGIVIEYQQYNYPGASFLIPRDRRFNLSFSLAGIGTFSNFFGAFGGGRY